MFSDRQDGAEPETAKIRKFEAAVDEQKRRRAEFERLKAERGVTHTKQAL